MAYINRNNWRLNRRHMLRGVGATIALPFLNCMRVNSAFAKQINPLPKRSVFIYVPNGVNTLTWQIEKAGSEYEFTEALKPLEKHREKITPISGLHHANGLGENHQCDKIWLTGSEINDRHGAFTNSVSADQMIAEVTGQQTRFASLELSITGKTLAWTREGAPLPSERKPSVVFQRLFGIEPVDSARRRLKRQSSVLDLVLESARGLRRDLGNEDCKKLDEYLNSVREVEIRTKRADAWLDVPKPDVDAKTKSRLTRDIPVSAAGDYYRTIYDFMVLALRTDMTRVITCMTGNENYGLAIPEIGVTQTRHELSHHNGDPKQMAKLTECDAFLSEQFSYFLSQLDAYSESGNSLLDQTIVLYGSGMAYGHGHGNANLPTILAGGSSLGFKHGQHLDYNLPHIRDYNLEDAQAHYRICTRPIDPNARFNNLLLTMLQRMDVQTESFGDSLGTMSEIVV